MQNDTYLKDGATRVLELMKDTFGSRYIAYFNGDAEPGESSLPCIMVSSQTATVASGASSTDDIDESVLIILSRNRKDDLGAGPDDELTEFKLRKDVFGQDPNTMQYLEGTVMYALRKHFTLNGAAIENAITIDFAPNVRNAVIPTQEAYVTINLTRLAIVPSRD